jgi:hypothetical protein
MKWKGKGKSRFRLFKVLFAICLEPRKTNGTFAQNDQFPGRVSNPTPPEYEPGMLTTRPRRFTLHVDVHRKIFVVCIAVASERTVSVSETQYKCHATRCQPETIVVKSVF